MLTALLMLSLGVAQAGEWSNRPIENKVSKSGTAYTIDKNQFRLGLVNQDYGLLENTSVGTIGGLWLFAIPNVHTKITAIQTPLLDVSFDAGLMYYNLENIGIANSKMTAVPIGWIASITPHTRFSAHVGTGWAIGTASGQLTIPQIAKGVRQLTGARIQDELRFAMGGGGGLYANANITLFQTRFSMEYRMNRRDAIVFRTTNWTTLNGFIAAGTTVNNNADVDLEVGASARVRIPLKGEVPALTTLSWQSTWRRVQMRVGIPLPLTNWYAYVQAIDLVMTLGPDDYATIDADDPALAEPVEEASPAEPEPEQEPEPEPDAPMETTFGEVPAP